MNALQLVGVASMVFVAVFTWRAYRAGGDPRAALIESWLNLLVGFSVNLLANFVLLPLVGVHPSFEANFWLGWPYTVVSLLRQYAIRRWCQANIHSLALAIAGVLR